MQIGAHSSIYQEKNTQETSKMAFKLRFVWGPGCQKDIQAKKESGEWYEAWSGMYTFETLERRHSAYRPKVYLVIPSINAKVASEIWTELQKLQGERSVDAKSQDQYTFIPVGTTDVVVFYMDSLPWWQNMPVERNQKAIHHDSVYFLPLEGVQVPSFTLFKHRFEMKSQNHFKGRSTTWRRRKAWAVREMFDKWGVEKQGDDLKEAIQIAEFVYKSTHK